MSINECCKTPENLAVSEVRGANTDGTAPQLTIRVCKVCKRRHFEVIAQPVRLGTKGAAQ